MKNSVDEVYTQIQQLPPPDRAELLQRLLVDLHGPVDEEIEKAWMQEAERRLDAYDRGETKAIPAEEVWRSIKERKRP